MGFFTAILAAALTTSREEAHFLPVGERCAQMVLDSASDDHERVLVVASLGPWHKKTRFLVRTEPHAGRRAAAPPPPPPILKRRLPVAEAPLDEAASFPPLARPPSHKTFHIFVGESDLEEHKNYKAVAGRLHSFSRHCQVYVDADEPAAPHRELAVADILRCFEKDVRPWALRHLGPVDDVDRDGRFAVFLTSSLNRMQGGRAGLQGFVRGSDFFIDLPAPFSNQCDMLVLHGALPPGARLRTVLAHEYAHAVTFCGHALRRYSSGPRHQDEESWLSESLSHLAEELLARWCPPETGKEPVFDRGNINQRVHAYLDQPEIYPVVVPDTFAAGLWRSHGVRGAGLLFLKSVHARHGDKVLARLTQTNLCGKANLEAATGESFEDLFRGFGVDLARRSGWAPASLSPDGVREFQLPGTGMAFFRLKGSACCITVHAETDTPFQATLVRRPRQ